MSKANGGAAFPDPGRAQSAKQREQLTETGMTLRDYFAARAMQAYLMTYDNQRPPMDRFAATAYEMADAMIAARGAA